MKQLLFGMLGLLGAATTLPACQPATSAKVPPAATPAPAATAAAAATPVADSTAAVLALTRQVDLALLWGNKTKNAKIHGPMEGFYGPNNYRISFYFDSVRRDPARLNVFHVQGRDKYKKVVTPFTGTLTVTRVATPLPDTAGLLLPAGLRTYSAFASFELREDPTAHGAGWCRGRAALDFALDQQGHADQLPFDGIPGDGNPTMGCGLLFRGTWTDNRTGQHKAVSWANYYGVIVPDVLREMGLGSRADEVHPRLARYGWNEAWENDEWWATSPKPKLSL